MKDKKISIRDLYEGRGKINLKLEMVAGEYGLDKEICVGDINRPGLTLSGFFDFFAFERLQVFGLGETAYISKLSAESRREVWGMFFSYNVLSCIFTHDQRPDEIFIEMANEKNVPTFVTGYRTTRFVSLWTHAVEEVFAPAASVHGTLVDVFGVGVLLIGKSGVGKSECALELVEKGHRLVADDIVKIKKIDEIFLFGKSAEIIMHHMEIRGLGIINLKDLYGISSVRNRKRVELVVQLEVWDEKTEYDRLGIDEEKYTILDIEVPYIVIPVRPGRNIPILIETAALNRRLKKMGIYSARDLDARIQNLSMDEEIDYDRE